MSVAELLLAAAARSPDALAVRAPEGAYTYAELSRRADDGARALVELGVRPGDRVGVLLDKSGHAVAAMQATLRLGAAYVPLDPSAPPARNRAIVEDGGLRVLFSRQALAEGLTDAARFVSVDGGLPGVNWRAVRGDGPAPRYSAGPHELAYVLYTSGSTGVPKGVCISHQNCLAFVEWARAEVGLRAHDRLANHAPFVFDLSVFDLYAAFAAGASVTLVPEVMAYEPRRLVELMQRDAITVWYSVPSALILMMDRGGLLEAELPALRTVIFAGEPFPVKPLRRLRERLSQARLFNFYGPTETNVCTAYEVTTIAPERVDPMPIGRASCGDRAFLRPLDASDGSGASGAGEASPAGSHAPDGAHPIGELMIEGPTVMLGYWGRPPHQGPYPTGDVCRLLPDGNFEYVGRRDHMVKVRGRRVELGEVEAALASHPAVEQVAVVVAGAGLEARLVAFLVVREPVGLVKLKLHSADRLPNYMILDEARFVGELPRTRNGKVDRAALQRALTAGESP